MIVTLFISLLFILLLIFRFLLFHDAQQISMWFARITHTPHCATPNQCKAISWGLTSVSSSSTSFRWTNDQPSDNNKSLLMCCSIQWPRIQCLVEPSWPKLGAAVVSVQILNMLTPMLALPKSFEKLVWDLFRDLALGFATYRRLLAFISCLLLMI